MNDMQKGITTLLRSAVTGEKLPLPSSFSLEEALPFISKQHIVTLVYTGAVNCGIDASEPVMQRLFTEYCRQLLRSEKQMAAVNEIFREFDAANIDYLPLKGVIMKPLYPKPELRWMGDADIMIRTSQYDIIRPIMHKLGFEELSFSDNKDCDNELKWKSPSLFLELHRHLMPSSQQLYYSFFDKVLLSGISNNNCFVMSTVDHYIFMIAHIAKHLLNGGIGCRYILDLWIFKLSHPEMSSNIIKKNLQKINLLEFFQNLQNLIAVWFEDGSPNKTSDFLTDILFDGGSWGTSLSRALSVQIRKSDPEKHINVSKANLFLNIVFPKAERIKSTYPILVDHPWTLPFIWPIRWLDVLFFKRRSIMRKGKELRYINSERANTYRDNLKFVGLHYDADLADDIPDNTY